MDIKVILKYNLQQKVRKHIPSDLSMPAILSFKSIENKNDVYRGKVWHEQVFESLREHATKLINFKIKTPEIYRKYILHITSY